MADDRIDIEFEQIVPWNGANDTGRDVRMKWQRNFERVRVSLQELESRIGEGAHVSDEDLQNILSKANTYTDAQVEAGIQLAVETAVEQANAYTDTQVEAAVDLAVETAVEQANAYTDIQIEAVRSEIGNLDDKYLRKDIPDTAQGHITFVQGLTAQRHSTFEEGVTVYGLAELMRLDVQELATIAQAVVQMMRSTRFVDGFAGEGYQIWQDIATGDWSMTLDRLTVRKVMAIYELIVQKIRSVGGMVVVSAANGKFKTVERMGSMYVLEMEDDCQFQPHDLMRCQVFSSSGLKYYWVEVADVQSGRVYVPVSEFGGVEPAVGDEVVLMGNTTNTLRQNLILISATEDGQPRFDCLDGVNSKSFADCLKVRVGALDGISDSRFPADLQPQGYGLYGNNCYLTGVFVLSNGKDVQTMFSITEGLIKSEISSVRQEINEQDNYLSNASFTASLAGWQYGQDIRVFTVSNRLLMFNRNLYGRKDAFAGIVDEGTKNVLRIKDSYIRQLNADLNQHPNFDTYKETETNEETGEEIVLREYRKARMFHVSFRYRCTKPGTLRIYFVGEQPLDFDGYEPLDYSCQLSPTEEFAVLEAGAKWNGTGDFYLSFDGDLYLYDLALSDNRLADVEEMFKSRFEQDEQKIQANLEHIIKTDVTVEEHYSELLMTAEQMQLSFSSSISYLSGRLTTHTSSFHVSSEKIESMVNATTSLSDRLTTAETKITQNADAITLRATKTELNKVSGDLTTHTGSFHVTSEKIESMVNATTSLSDRLTTAETKITQNADAITLRATKTELNKVSGDLTTHTGSFHVTSEKIESMVNATTSLSDRLTTAETKITQNADAITLRATKTELNKVSGDLTTHTGSFHVSSDKIASMVSETTALGTKVSTIEQTAGSIQASVNDLDGRYSSLKLQVDAIGAVVGDGTDGSFSEFQQTLDSLTTTVAESKTAAEAAKQTAADAAAAAAAAKNTADSALAKAGENATAIVQTQQSISAIAGLFDENGHLIEGSGWVTTTEGNTLWATKTELNKVSGDLTTHTGSFHVTSEKISSMVSASDNAAKAATDAANAAAQAALDAANAQSTADSALAKAGENATAIVQTNNSISALAGKFTFDADGNITNYSKSGLVLTSNFATLFSKQATADGLVKQADISTFITETEAGELISKASIRADQIDLTGKVTFDMFSSDLQGTLDGKVDTSRLGSLAYQSAVSAAMLDSTIIEGGYIKTSLIDVNNLVAKNLVAGDGITRYEIDWRGMRAYNVASGDATFYIDGVSNGFYCENYIRLYRKYFEASEYSGDVIHLRLHPDRIEFVKNGKTLRTITAESG